MKLPPTVPGTVPEFAGVKVSQWNSHRSGFEGSFSGMIISDSTAMIIACKLAKQTNRAAHAYDAAFYMSLHEWCGRSVGDDCVRCRIRSAHETVSCCTGVCTGWKMGVSMLTDVYCEVVRVRERSRE
jgi:hypothetical protein